MINICSRCTLLVHHTLSMYKTSSFGRLRTSVRFENKLTFTFSISASQFLEDSILPLGDSISAQSVCFSYRCGQLSQKRRIQTENDALSKYTSSHSRQFSPTKLFFFCIRTFSTFCEQISTFCEQIFSRWLRQLLANLSGETLETRHNLNIPLGWGINAKMGFPIICIISTQTKNKH